MLTAEDGSVEIGERCVVMENALLRGRAQHPTRLGDDVLVGPHAHVNGTTIEDGCFIATGAALFPGAVVGAGSEVRIHGVVQVNTVLPPGSTVPIGWVAVGDPAQILAPDRHDDIWAIQRELDVPGTDQGSAAPSASPRSSDLDRALPSEVQQRDEDVDDRDEDAGRQPDHVVLGGVLADVVEVDQDQRRRDDEDHDRDDRRQ